MPRLMSLERGFAVALLSLWLLAPAASPSLAEETAMMPILGERVALDYKAFKGGFRVMDIGIALDLSEAGRYLIGLEGELVGAPALLFTYEIALSAEGKMSETGPIPERYRNDSINGSKRKADWLELNFDTRGVPQVTGDPLPADEARPPVTDGRRKGALDLLSGLLQVVQQTLTTQGCDVKVGMFDGRRRFDAVSKDAGIRELQKSSINIYSGPARLCEIRVKPLAGYRFDGRDTRNLPRVIEAYLAPPEPDLPELPVRMIIRTGWGAVLVHLVGVQTGEAG